MYHQNCHENKNPWLCRVYWDDEINPGFVEGL